MVERTQWEFRGFVSNGKLTAITQYFSVCYFEELARDQAAICAKLVQYHERIKQRIQPHLASYGIDFFIASEDIANAATEVRILPDSNIATHRPVQLTLPANVGELKKLAFVTAQRFPKDPAIGPRQPPPSWESVKEHAAAAIAAAQQCTSASKIRHALAVA